MTQPDEHPILVEIATTIADGQPVDWESLAAEHPELRSELEALKVLQAVEASRRAAGEETPKN